MQAPLTSARQPSKTSGTVNYLEPSPDGTAPHVYLVEPPQGVPKISFVRSETTVDVHNLREFQDRFTLKERGIELRKLEIPEDIDWENKEEVSRIPCSLHCTCYSFYQFHAELLAQYLQSAEGSQTLCAHSPENLASLVLYVLGLATTYESIL